MLEVVTPTANVNDEDAWMREGFRQDVRITGLT